MKKIIATISVLLLFVMMLTACGDPVTDDLINYSNKQMKSMVELQSKIAADYSACVSDKNVTNEIIAAKLKDATIPQTKDLLAKAKAIVPATEEVKKIHKQYVDLLTVQLDGFTLLQQGIQKNDEASVKAAEEKMTSVEKASKQYSTDLTALKKAHNVVDAK